MLRAPFAVCLLLPVLGHACVVEPLGSRSFEVTGNVTTTAGTALYSETLTQRGDERGGKLEVLYLDPDGAKIARKTVDYNCNLTTPSFELSDFRANTREGVRWKDTTAESYQGDQVEILDVPEGQAIVDAGFDNAIRLNWDALLGGDTIRFNYLFARENSFVKLRLKRGKPPKFLAGEIDASTVFFRISASNFFFRMLSDSIYVGYDRESGDLRYYVGPSNLPSMATYDTVVIRYPAKSE